MLYMDQNNNFSGSNWAESCSWDPALVEKSSKFEALEASSAGINWTFAPMVDIARDPRWGRIVEGFRGGSISWFANVSSEVRGFQGDFSEFQYSCMRKALCGIR